MELGDDHALRPVDDEGTAAGHHRQLAHIDALLFGAGFILELERHIECRAEALAIAERIQRGDLGVLNIISDEVQFNRFIIALDWKDFTKHGL